MKYLNCKTEVIIKGSLCKDCKELGSLCKDCKELSGLI